MSNAPSYLSRYRMYWQALRAGWLSLFFGTVTLIALLFLLWGSVERSLEDKKAAVHALLATQVSARAASYAVQLEDLTDRMTQVADLITQQWERAPQSLNLRESLAGLLSSKRMLYVVVLDDQARVVAASFPTKVDTLPRVDFFESLRAGCCSGWLVTPVSYAPLVGQDVARFTRRLNRPDGSFGGVLIFAALPNFLETFQDDSVIARGDFVNLRLLDGPVLMSKHSAADPEKLIDLRAPLIDADSGVRLEPGDRFADGLPRYVAWRKHSRLPLVALAGMSGREELAEFEATARTYRTVAGLTTFALLAVATAIVVGVASAGARRLTQDEVRRTYRLATDAANEGYYMLRPIFAASGAITELLVEDCNERGATMLGFKRDALVDRQIARTLSPALRDSLLDACERTIRYGVIEDEYRVPPGTQLQASWVYRRLMHSGTGIAFTLRDISALKAHQEELNRLANNDALTGLPNRHWLMHQMPLAIDRAQRSHAQMALLFIDLDNFKIVNDTLGHDMGDALLVEAAGRLRQAVRASDQVVRLGGDEFTVVLEQVVTPAVVAQVAQKILQVLCEPFAVLGSSALRVTASIGASVYPTDGTTPDLLLKNADVAMYAAKAAGRAQFRSYEPQMSYALYQRLGVEEALRGAIERDELSLHYQPRYDAHSGRLQSLEALVRWNHPQRGMLLPGDFIEMASEVGLAPALDDHVMQMLVAQLADWRDQHGIEVPVSFNVSSEKLRGGQFAARLAGLLDAHGIPPQQLEVEIAEATLVERRGTIASEINALRALGVRVAVDDFGSGQSALGQLLHLKLDALKIDNALTDLLTKQSGSELLYGSIVSMAKALNMRVVAEGVETREQLAVLQSLDCDEVQGFLVSQPVTADAVPALVSGAASHVIARPVRVA